MSMIYQDSSNFGKQIPIYVRYKVLEDSTKAVSTTVANIYAGLPVTVSCSGDLTAVTTNVAVYGLAKFQYNGQLDEVTGTQPAGIYGSNKGTVVVKGIVDVLTVMPFTDACSVHLVDTVGLVPMAPLYVSCVANGDGVYPISANVATWTNTQFGVVLNYDSTNGVLQILLP